MQQATQSALDSISPIPVVAPNAQSDCTIPERPVRIYSYWGSPIASVGEDGDFVFEEISGTLIGPKMKGEWPEDLIRIEGPVVGKRGCFPRWRGSEKQNRTMTERWVKWLKNALLFLLAGAA
jgi:hypothetical protein